MKLKSFNHTGIIDLRKAKSNSLSTKFRPTHICLDGFDVDDKKLDKGILLTSDMIKSIDFNRSYYMNIGYLTIHLTNYHEHVFEQNLANYELSNYAKIRIGRIMFGSTFDKLSKFANTNEYLTALCNLYDIVNTLPHTLKIGSSMGFSIVYNKYSKDLKIYSELSNLDGQQNQIIGFSSDYSKMVKLHRVLNVLKSNTYSRNEVIDIIIKANKY